ncbi:suppressor of gamma response 1, partial [Tanacetum coccineum]
FLESSSEPTHPCRALCGAAIENADSDSDLEVTHAWTGLPRGVKFDPLDHEIMWHLLAKSGVSGFQPHPFIDELFQLL